MGEVPLPLSVVASLLRATFAQAREIRGQATLACKLGHGPAAEAHGRTAEAIEEAAVRELVGLARRTGGLAF